MQETNLVNATLVQDHPNVLKMYEYFEDENFVYLVTE